VDRKGIGMEVLVLGILVPLIGFFAIMGIYNAASTETDVEASMQACKFSILMSDRIGDASHGIFNIKTLCKTHDLDMPEKKGLILSDDEKGMYKNIGTRMNDCWWEFGEGTQTGSAFAAKGTDFFDTKCFACFNFNIEKYKEDNLNFEEFFTYIKDEALHVRKDRVLICEVLEKQQIKNIDCVMQEEYDKMPECEKKGGKCGVCTVGETQAYDKWECDEGETCCVDNNKMVTYLSNIYMEKGRGSVWFSDEIATKGFSKGEEYSIVYVSGKKSFTQQASRWIMGGGGVAGGAAGIAAGVALVSNPVGWVALSIGVVGAGVGVGAAALTQDQFEEQTKKNDKIIVTKVAEIEDHCTLTEGAGKRT